MHYNLTDNESRVESKAARNERREPPPTPAGHKARESLNNQSGGKVACATFSRVSLPFNKWAVRRMGPTAKHG